jgi:DNA-binding transcriptional regulator YiaG
VSLTYRLQLSDLSHDCETLHGAPSVRPHKSVFTQKRAWVDLRCLSKKPVNISCVTLDKNRCVRYTDFTLSAKQKLGPVSRMSLATLVEVEQALSELKAERDALAGKLMAYGVKKIERLDRRLGSATARIAKSGLLRDKPEPSPTRSEIAAKVRAVREALGLSQIELADRMGVSPSTSNRWERGELGMRSSVWLLLQTLKDTNSKLGD